MSTLVRGTGALVLSFALVAAATHARAEPERFEILPDTKGTEVVFHSKATMESFEGSTQKVEGWIDVDPASLEGGFTWNVSVDLASLDTGIGLRNRHMRENHLHTDEHPRAVFQGTASAPGELVAGSPVHLDVEGRFTLHGVTVERSIPVVVTLRPDGALEIAGEFTVSLAAHEISRPKFLVLKLADEQRVEVFLSARPVGGQS